MGDYRDARGWYKDDFFPHHQKVIPVDNNFHLKSFLTVIPQLKMLPSLFFGHPTNLKTWELYIGVYVLPGAVTLVIARLYSGFLFCACIARTDILAPCETMWLFAFCPLQATSFIYYLFFSNFKAMPPCIFCALSSCLHITFTKNILFWIKT